MSPTQSDNERESEVCESGEEDPLTQMLNDLSLTDANAKTTACKEPTIDLVESLRHLDIKKEDDEKQNEENEPEEIKENLTLEEVNKHEEDELKLNDEENEEKIKLSEEKYESFSDETSKNNDIQSDEEKTADESDDENPPDDDYTHEKSFDSDDKYESENSYKPELENSADEDSLIKSKVDEETPKKPKTKTRYASRGLGSGAGGGMEFQNAFPDQFMYQGQFGAATPYSIVQPSGSDCGNLGSNGQMYMNQNNNNYQDQYIYPLTPPFSDGASIQDESDFSDGVPSPMAPSQQDFVPDYTPMHDEHSLDDILEVLNKEKFGGLDVTGCVPPEKIMPYLQELLRIPEGSENTDNTGNNQEISPIQPRLKPREIIPDGRVQTSAEHEIRKRLSPEVLEKTSRQINYQENEKLCEKDEEGDTPYMVVVSNYERKNYYELLYAMQERLKTIRMCCDLPVCVRTHTCKVCGNSDDLQFYSPLSMRNNVGDTALKNAVSMKFPKEVVNYLCSGLEERQGDMRRVFDMEASNFFQQNSFIYPVLARFL